MNVACGWQTKWMRKEGPVHGPYADVSQGPDGHWRIRLNEEGRRHLAEFLTIYPKPVKLLIGVWPRIYKTAITAGISHEEIESTCYEGLVLSVIRWNPDRPNKLGCKIKLSTVAAWGMRASLVDLLRRENKHSSLRFVSHLMESSDEHHLQFDPPAPSELPPGHTTDIEKLSRRAELTPQERTILALRYGLSGPPLPLAEIGMRFGFCKERARQYISRAMRKLRFAAGVCTAEELVLRKRIVVVLRRGCLSQTKLRQAVQIDLETLRLVTSQLATEGIIVRRHCKKKRPHRVFYYLTYTSDRIRECV